MPLSVGYILNNRYRIVTLLGTGGFGAVYRAWDVALNRPCALKENLDASPQAYTKFQREAMILANINHPNLVRVTDHFFLPNQGQYLVMDYVEGQDLQEILEKNNRQPLPERQVLDWGAQICDALDYLHSQNSPIIHRDLKPANIKITPEGKAMLVDFGIAKVYDPNTKTTQGARAVTPGYSPFEQYGQGSTDARTDVYALGATLYTALTGNEPVESIQRNLGLALTAPRSLNPLISSQTESAIIRAMALMPDQRYQRASDLADALRGSKVTPLLPAAITPSSKLSYKPLYWRAILWHFPFGFGLFHAAPDLHRKCVYPFCAFYMMVDFVLIGNRAINGAVGSCTLILAFWVYWISFFDVLFTCYSRRKQFSTSTPPKPNYAEAIYLHLILGFGLFAVNPPVWRKWLYPVAIIYACADMLLGSAHVQPFDSTFGGMTFLLGVGFYFVGFADALYSCYSYRKKTP